jgi:hypothetical protein
VARSCELKAEGTTWGNSGVKTHSNITITNEIAISYERPYSWYRICHLVRFWSMSSSSSGQSLIWHIVLGYKRDDPALHYYPIITPSKHYKHVSLSLLDSPCLSPRPCGEELDCGHSFSAPLVFAPPTRIGRRKTVAEGTTTAGSQPRGLPRWPACSDTP